MDVKEQKWHTSIKYLRLSIPFYAHWSVHMSVQFQHEMLMI